MQLYSKIDALLESGGEDERKKAYDLAEEKVAANERNADFLWRYARAAFLYSQCFKGIDENRRKELVFQGKFVGFSW